MGPEGVEQSGRGDCVVDVVDEEVKEFGFCGGEAHFFFIEKGVAMGKVDGEVVVYGDERLKRVGETAVVSF